MQLYETWLPGSWWHAALAGIEGSIDAGLTGTGRLQVLAKAAIYVKTYVPRALAALGITPEQVEAIVLSKLAKTRIAAAVPRSEGIEGPALALAAGQGPGPERS